MVWGDLEIGSIARGAKEFLGAIAQDRAWLQNNKVILVGRVSRTKAERIIGNDLLSVVKYSSFLEDDEGKLRHAKVTVVPDVGGAGTKNRSVNLLSSGKCLACLYPQMEGVDRACDRGAINASEIEELVERVKMSLQNHSYLHIGETGGAIYQQQYNLRVIRQLWYELVERALSIRAMLNTTLH